MILVAYRHGLRASEFADLEWSQVELGRNATLHVRRGKNSKPSAHPLRGAEVRAPCANCGGYPRIPPLSSGTDRGGLFTPDAINRSSSASARARFAFPIHAHMLRHASGYALANAGHETWRIQDWLGQRSIQHTTRYTQLSAALFEDFWR